MGKKKKQNKNTTHARESMKPQTALDKTIDGVILYVVINYNKKKATI